MGARYTAGKTGTAMVAATDMLTITAPAGRSLKIWAVRLYGEGTASAANEVGVFRSTSGVTPVAATPTPVNADSTAATFTVATAWTTQPTLGAQVSRIGVNSNGSTVQQVYPPGQEIDVPGGGQISIRPVTGTGVIAVECLVEQI